MILPVALSLHQTIQTKFHPAQFNVVIKTGIYTGAAKYLFE